MKKMTVMWTALPHGVAQDANAINLSVFVSLRLHSDEGHQLGQFPDMISEESDWPAVVRNATFKVKLGSQTFAAQRVSADPDSELWRGVFPSHTFVRPYEFTDLSTRTVVSYPVKRIHDTLKRWYGTLGAAAGDRLPSPLELWNMLGGGILREVPLRDEVLQRLRDEQHSLGEPIPADVVWDFGLLKLFHHPAAKYKKVHDDDPAKSPDEQATWSSVEKAELPRPGTLADQPEFHQMLSTLNQYPQLLRRLGLVIELQLPDIPDSLLPTAPTNQTVQIVPGWDHSLSQEAGVTIHTGTPVTRALLGATDFWAESKTALLSAGMLDLSQQDLDLIQVDVDGLAIKAYNVTATLERLIGNGVDQEIGAPSPRDGGLALVQSGRANALLLKLKDTLNNNDVLTGPIGGTIELQAEALIRGYYVDIWDESAQRWRSLCMRRGTYRRTDINEPIGGMEDDEGVVQMGATEAPDQETTGDDRLFVPETLVDWKGWSLVAPRPGTTIHPDEGEFEIITNTAEPGIPLEVNFTVVPGSLPRLRYGHHYKMRIRVADLAGNSRPFSPDDIDQAKYDSSDEHYLRFDPVSSPVLALIRDEDGSVHEPEEGESMDRMAIRSFNTAQTEDDKSIKTVNQRLVFPPRTSQLAAETLGKFDEVVSQPNTPATVRLRKADYSVIVGKEGSLDKETISDKPNDPAFDHTYTVAQVGDAMPYLPDPLAHATALRLLDRLGNVLLDIDPIDWLHPKSDWYEAQPFRVQLEEGSGPPTFDSKPKMRILHLPVPKGEVRILRLSSKFDTDDLKLFGIWQWIKDEFKPDPNKPTLAQLQTRAANGHHWMLSPWRELELVHAVQQPLGIPQLEELTTDRTLGETSARVLFRTPLHRASTLKLDLLAEWNDAQDDPEANGPSYKKRKAQAYQVQVPLEGLPDQFSILDEFDEKLPRHEFGDTKYRRVTYHVEATTRYREYLKPSVTGNKENLLRRSQKQWTWVANSARPVPPKLLYALPTFRWKYSEDGTQRHRYGRGIRVYMERPWFSSGFGEMLAVVLPPGFADAGTLDELRGYVSEWGSDPFWQSASLPRPALDLAHFPLARTAPHSSDVTLPGYIPADELPLPIENFPVTGLTLEEKPDFAFVAAPHDVAYDDKRHLWYCDIELDAGDAYFPFVRLALARYHPIALPDAHLSQIVLADFLQLAPDRSLSIVKTSQAGNTWAATLTGPGYSKSSASVEPGIYGLGPQLDEFGPALDFDRSAVQVVVERLDEKLGKDFGWKPAPGAQVNSFAVGPPVLWQGTITLPSTPSETYRYRLVIKEKERYAADPEKVPVSSTDLLQIGDRITYADIVPLV